MNFQNLKSKIDYEITQTFPSGNKDQQTEPDKPFRRGRIWC
ncbi:MAG: cyanobactin biosynthesis PatC/TenC/TruC family protein [Aphanizomenon flos-aquae KM1D3_PB]|nr:cyanobactin biosynthesis PatC/TenC/TruC family protein [Aphanizomenon sp. UHCC 0183]QSV74528.1 MAG: cyanobactin biosynthesis PatC/TenC/TruC family protein [Aphanizomenon flos-aquae KM1D3_PB]